MILRKYKVYVCPNCGFVGRSVQEKRAVCCKCTKTINFEKKGFYFFDFNHDEEALAWCKHLKKLVALQPWNLKNAYASFMQRRKNGKY